MRPSSLSNWIGWFVVALTFVSVNQWSRFPIGNTFTNWALWSVLVFLFIKGIKPYFDKANRKELRWYYSYLVWVLICVFRGFFVAENYWDWKNLINGSFSLLISLSLPVFTNTQVLAITLRRWLRWALPGFLLIAFFIPTDAYGFFLQPIVVLILLFPLLKGRWRIISIVVLVMLLGINLDARSTILKLGLAFACSFLFYIPTNLRIFWIKRLRKVLLFIPFIFGGLGMAGVFNVFNISDYAGEGVTTQAVVDGEVFESTTSSDTRTFIYEEVINSAFEHGYFIWGRTLAKGNDSESFGAHLAEELGITGRYERYSNEAGITNIFTWTGIIGVILYFIVFFKASYLAIYESKSRFLQVFGLYVAFRWAFSWVEDFTFFDITNITLWMMLGLCYSRAFRNMNELEFRRWFQGVFLRSKNQQIGLSTGSITLNSKTKRNNGYRSINYLPQ